MGVNSEYIVLSKQLSRFCAHAIIRRKCFCFVVALHARHWFFFSSSYFLLVSLVGGMHVPQPNLYQHTRRLLFCLFLVTFTYRRNACTNPWHHNITQGGTWRSRYGALRRGRGGWQRSLALPSEGRVMMTTPELEEVGHPWHNRYVRRSQWRVVWHSSNCWYYYWL